MLAGMCMSFCTFSTSEIASPREVLGERLNETVTAGNCPWWLMESSSVVLSKWQNALSGTRLLMLELVEPADVAPVVAVLLDRALPGGVSVLAAGVKRELPVSAFEPAEVEPDAAKEVDAPGPLVPEDELAWI